MRLSQSHESGHGFGWLTRVDSYGFWFLFLIDLFFNFIFRYYVGWKLSFIIYFDFFSIGLTHIDLTCFFRRMLFSTSSFNIRLIENLI